MPKIIESKIIIQFTIEEAKKLKKAFNEMKKKYFDEDFNKFYEFLNSKTLSDIETSKLEKEIKILFELTIEEAKKLKNTFGKMPMKYWHDDFRELYELLVEII